MEQQDKWKMDLDIKWNTVEDTCSKEFFKLHSKHRSRNLIKEIEHNDILMKDSAVIKQAIMEYYTGLYTRDEAVNGNNIA